MKRRFICPICSCWDLSETDDPDEPRRCANCGYETRSDNEYEEAEKKYRRPEPPTFGFFTGYIVRPLDSAPGPVFDSWHDDDDDDEGGDGYDPGDEKTEAEYERLKKKAAFLGGHATITIDDDDMELKLSSFNLDAEPPKRTPFDQRAMGGYEFRGPFKVVRTNRSYNVSPVVNAEESRRHLAETLRDELQRAREAIRFPCLGPEAEA